MHSTKKTLYVQYGCGTSAPKEWTNFDASPTLRIQRMPMLGFILKKYLNVQFPHHIQYGDIRRGLPGIGANTCAGIFCSHVLEHLSLNDCRTAINKTFQMLKPGGILRCIVPDLEYIVREYLTKLDHNVSDASIQFMKSTALGRIDRTHGLSGFASDFFGNSNHLFMWDRLSLHQELANANFSSIRPCKLNDSTDPMFKLVEDPQRFQNAIAFEATK
jgi:ubiquinone/menaquinone biosynthesis C-methylase UbiE